MPLERLPVVFVLFQPQDVVNVAGVVRVMSNFGLHRLRLVEPAAFDRYRIEGIAHHTGDIIQAVERFPDLAAALADCSLVLGTTARPRAVRRDRLTPRQAAPALLAAARQNPGAPPAVLFGREDWGLPNWALDLCHGLITIPTHPGNPSLNLAQAALVVAYELWLAHSQGAGAPPGEGAGVPDATPVEAAGAPGAARGEGGGAPPTSCLLAALAEDARLATGVQREAMFAALADLLRALYPHTTDQRLAHAMARLRAVLLRAAPRHDEARSLAHLFQHLAQVARRARR